MSSGPRGRSRKPRSSDAENEAGGSDADVPEGRVRSLRDNPAGHLDFEQRRAIWRWNTPGGDYDQESTQMLIRRLDNPELSIDDSGWRSAADDPAPARRATGTPDLEAAGRLARAATPPREPPAVDHDAGEAGHENEDPGFFELSLQTTGQLKLAGHDKRYQPYGDCEPPPPDSAGRKKRRR